MINSQSIFQVFNLTSAFSSRKTNNKTNQDSNYSLKHVKLKSIIEFFILFDMGKKQKIVKETNHISSYTFVQWLA